MIPKQFLNAKRYEPASIDIHNKNSVHALVVELTGYDRFVLEVGTSTGYLSQILTKRGNRIVGIEVDPEAAQVAQNYCQTMIVGDIEFIKLEEKLENRSFDVILLTDVLEHLHWPGEVLRKLKSFLKPDGYLVVSLPNIGHGDIVLSLFQGKFPYAAKGLLDITHVRFFTLEEALSLFRVAGYTIADLHPTTISVGETEIPLVITNIAPEIISFVRTLPYANIYEFVFRAYPDDRGTIPNRTVLPKIQVRNISCFKDDQIDRLKAIAKSQENDLLAIYNSRGWKALMKYRRWKGMLFSSERAKPKGPKKFASFARAILKLVKMGFL